MITPSIQALTENLVGQLEANLQTTFLEKSFSRVLAKAEAGVWMILYKYAGFMLLQLFVAHATDKPTRVNGKVIRPLVEWGRLVGAGDPKPATRAELVIAAQVLTQSGSIPAGAIAVRPQSQVVYEVVAEVALDAPVVPVTIRAVADASDGGGAGTIGNLQVGDVVEFARTIPNVATKALVTSVKATGEDVESRENYRARVMRRFQRRPQGGAYADYQSWAEEVPGIVNAYPYASEAKPGEVVIYVEASAESSGSPSGIPTSAQLSAVNESIQAPVNGLPSRRPVNAAVTVLPIKRVPFSVTIVGLDPNTEQLRNAVADGIREYLLTREPFIEGLSLLPREDRITDAALSGIAEAIANANGGSITSLRMTPGPAYVLGQGEKAQLAGAPTFL